MSAQVSIPGGLAATIAGVYGERGRVWVAEAPRIISAACDRWGVDLAEPFELLSYNYVAPGVLRDGARVVVKAGVPSQEMAWEISALRHFAGESAVRLLDADPGGAALLLERIEPGSTLSALGDDGQETRIAARVMRRLWRPGTLDVDLPSLAYLFDAFRRLRERHGGGPGPLPGDLLQRAEEEVAGLLGTAPSPMVLHGDFHHGNVLWDAERGWVVIDPPGAIGDPAAEPGMFLCNPHDRIAWTGDLPALMRRRIDIIAGEAELDAGRVTRWGFAWALLSACWHDEDGTGGEAFAMRCARALAAVADAMQPGKEG